MSVTFYNAEYYETTYNNQPIRAVYIPELKIKLTELGQAYERDESELYYRTTGGALVRNHINFIQLTVPSFLVTGGVNPLLIQGYFIEQKKYHPTL